LALLRGNTSFEITIRNRSRGRKHSPNLDSGGASTEQRSKEDWGQSYLLLELGGSLRSPLGLAKGRGRGRGGATAAPLVVRRGRRRPPVPAHLPLRSEHHALLLLLAPGSSAAHQKGRTRRLSQSAIPKADTD
jgi:hypothetical protein